jgi:FtsZ-binding cell division protein ZapB
MGGSDDPDNLVYCCHACNEFKGDFWSDDPVRRVLHPLRDVLPDHLVESIEYQIVPLTDTGRFHITLLHLNRPELIESRRRRREADILRRYTELQQRFETLAQQVERLSERIRQVTGGIPEMDTD